MSNTYHKFGEVKVLESHTNNAKGFDIPFHKGQILEVIVKFENLKVVNVEDNQGLSHIKAYNDDLLKVNYYE